MTKRKVQNQVRQDEDIYDATDLKMALEDLSKLGFDIQVETVLKNVHKLRVLCRKGNQRFMVTDIGSNDWPEDFTD